MPTRTDVQPGYRKQTQPQLWELAVGDKTPGQPHEDVQLLLSTIYPCETAGLFRLSCFGGVYDQLVLCTAKGDVCSSTVLVCFSNHVF